MRGLNWLVAACGGGGARPERTGALDSLLLLVLFVGTLLVGASGCDRNQASQSKASAIEAQQPQASPSPSSEASAKAESQGKPGSGEAIPKPDGTPESEAAALEAARKQAAEERENPLDSLPEQDKVDAIVNPRGLEPYAGPTGTVRGVVRVSGDEALPNDAALSAIKANCELAQKMFEKTFREGEGRTLADVFVGVTEYEGFVPRQAPKLVPVRAEGCAWQARTYGLMFGQVLSIQGLDRRAYVPELLGQSMPAQLFSLPGGDPVRLPPLRPGKFRLVDSMRLYNVADVIVVPFATFDVTGLDGRFEIPGVPVGQAKVSALLPVIGATTEQEVTVEDGKVTEVELTIAFDADMLEKP